MMPATLPDPSRSQTRQRPGAWRAILGMFGAPAAWLFQMSASEPLAAQACYPHTTPLPAPLWQSLAVVLAAVTMVALAAAVACALLAWSNWRMTHSDADHGDRTQTIEVGDGRERFLAALGLLSSGLFLAAILITGLAVLLVSPCSAWAAT